MTSRTLYEVLDVDESAGLDQIVAAYRRQVQLVHPDRGGSPALFRDVQEAYETLSDPLARAKYDQSLAHPQSSDAGGSSSDGSSGWTRVDHETTNTGDSRGAADSGGAAASGDAADSSPSPEPPPWVRPDSDMDHATTATGSSESLVAMLWSRHPAGSLAVFGISLIYIGGVARASGIAMIGFLVLVIAIVAAIGGRNLKRAGNRFYDVELTDLVLDDMSGSEFEHLLVELFRRGGYEVDHVGGPGDFGGDLVLEQSGVRTVVQAKRSAKPVGHGAVQEVVAAMAPYGARKAMVITTSIFTPHAESLAAMNGVILWNRQSLVAEMRRLALIQNNRTRNRFHDGWDQLAKQLKSGSPTVLRGAGVIALSSALMVISGNKRKRNGNRNGKRIG